MPVGSRAIIKKPAVAYCDGSFNPESKFGGWGYQLEQQGRRISKSGSAEGEAPTDFEVLAVIRVLEDTCPTHPLLVNTDCMAVVNAAAQLGKGKPLKSSKMRSALRLLYQRLADLLQGRQVVVKWVRGHAGIQGNVVVDRLAKSCMRQATANWEKTMAAVFAYRDEWHDAHYRQSIVGA